MRVARRTVDLSGYPDLVVIYLGMKVRTARGLKTLFGFGPKISDAVRQKPPGLLLHEDIIFSIFPPHLGMRQYWKDYESMERWVRSLPHMDWWRNFIRDSGGTGFWHETYSMRGGIEAIYLDISSPVGLARFAPVLEARGTMFSARRRLKLEGEPELKEPVSEEEYYR